MTQPLRIFVSATSRDLRSYRAAVADWLRGQGHEPVIQDDFDVQPDYVTIARMLRDKIAPCDAVVCLIGDYYGFETADFPPNEARRSYTQLEYELGKALNKPVRLFFTTNATPRDSVPEQSAEHAKLQKAYRDRLRNRDNPWYDFANVEELLGHLAKVQFLPTAGRPSNLPYDTIGSLFKGRDDFLQQLRASLTKRPTHVAAVTSKQAIHGLGGVGKTRAAIEYGWRYGSEYTALLYVTADSPQSLDKNLAALCGAMVLNLPEQDAREEQVQLAAALRWLEQHPGWFLILDNVDTPEAAQAVTQRLTRLAGGHVVITSRLSQWGGAVEALDLDVLAEGPAVEFLLEKTAGFRHVMPTDADDALELTRDLDGLALALEQAGAFIKRHRESIGGYRERWRKQEAKVLTYLNPLESQYPKSVAVTWETSFEQLGPDGQRLLRVLAWLAPEPIPVAMVQKLETGEGETPIDVEAGLAELVDYSLAKWKKAGETFGVHRLVQEVTRYRASPVDRRKDLSRSAELLVGFTALDPSEVAAWASVFEPAAPHIRLILKQSEAVGGLVSSARLASRLGNYLHQRGLYIEAESLMRFALEMDESRLGHESAVTAESLNNLGSLLQVTSRLREAEPLLRHALVIGRSVFGMNHPITSIYMNNVGTLYQEMNRHEDAEPLLRESLSMDERLLGPTHPNVPGRLSNLAQTVRALGRLEEAETLMRRAINLTVLIYGQDHPSTPALLGNLAQLLLVTGRSSDVELLMRRALLTSERFFGPVHPSVARDLNNLATLLDGTCRRNEAEPLLRRSLLIATAVYGSDHPTVAAAMNNLSINLYAGGLFREASELARDSLEIILKSSALNQFVHPEVDKACANCFCLLQAAGMGAQEASNVVEAMLIRNGFQIHRGS